MSNQGKCPHCLVVVQFIEPTIKVGNFQMAEGQVPKIDTREQSLTVTPSECPGCGKMILTGQLISKSPQKATTLLLYPFGSSRQPVPTEVPENIANMYREGALVLPFSEEASAALSRRCLQALLNEAGKSSKKDLVDQITEVLPALPPYLKTQVDAVRNIGNFAAHPSKSSASGEIVQVEHGEAEWNLDVLDMLFEFYYVQPKKIDVKRQALDKKLKEFGKPPMK